MTDAKAYWKENVSLVLKLLLIWFIVSYGMGILLVDYLDRFQFFGFPFGFWMAQQGSIYIFVALIFIYVFKMNKLDKKYDVEESDDHIPAEDLTKGEQ
ncbi:MAG: DUF4212 domain-containing protein [Emcibacteraceae bacterium]